MDPELRELLQSLIDHIPGTLSIVAKFLDDEALGEFGIAVNEIDRYALFACCSIGFFKCSVCNGPHSDHPPTGVCFGRFEFRINWPSLDWRGPRVSTTEMLCYDHLIEYYPNDKVSQAYEYQDNEDYCCEHSDDPHYNYYECCGSYPFGFFNARLVAHCLHVCVSQPHIACAPSCSDYQAYETFLETSQQGVNEQAYTTYLRNQKAAFESFLANERQRLSQLIASHNDMIIDSPLNWSELSP